MEAFGKVKQERAGLSGDRHGQVSLWGPFSFPLKLQSHCHPAKPHSGLQKLEMESERWLEDAALTLAPAYFPITGPEWVFFWGGG